MDDIKFVKAMLRAYPVLKEIPELEDISLFSPGARHIVPAILDANRGDKNTARFAVRLCRAITLYEEGQHTKKKPLYAGLLYGEVGAPLREIVTAVGESFIGNPVDGRAPLTIIDCAEYPPGTHPASLFQLTGPRDKEDPRIPSLWPDAYEEADLWSRAGNEILALERFIKRFEEWTLNIVKQLNMAFANTSRNPEVAEFVNGIFKNLYEQAKDAAEKTRSKNQPLRSVIVFDGIENASPELLARIRSIVQTGRLSIFRNGPEKADFSNSIILLTAYDPMFVSGNKGKIGLAPASDTPSRYSAVRKLLVNDWRFRDIVRELGDQTLVIRARSLDGQKHQLNRALKQVDKTYRKLNVRIVFGPSFKAWLLDKSREQNQKPEFPDYKVEEALDRYVKLPLAQKIASGQLHAYDTITFSAAKDAEFPEVTMTPGTAKLEAAVLTRDDFLNIAKESAPDVSETPTTQELYLNMSVATLVIQEYANSLLALDKAPETTPDTDESALAEPLPSTDTDADTVIEPVPEVPETPDLEDGE